MMKRPFALLLCLALCLTVLIPGTAFAQEDSIVCRPGDDINVVFFRTRVPAIRVRSCARCPTTMRSLPLYRQATCRIRTGFIFPAICRRWFRFT